MDVEIALVVFLDEGQPHRLTAELAQIEAARRPVVGQWKAGFGREKNSEDFIAEIANFHPKELVEIMLRRVISNLIDPSQGRVARIRRDENVLVKNVMTAAGLVRDDAKVAGERRRGAVKTLRVELAIVDREAAEANALNPPARKVSGFEATVANDFTHTAQPCRVSL